MHVPQRRGQTGIANNVVYIERLDEHISINITQLNIVRIQQSRSQCLIILLQPDRNERHVVVQRRQQA
jgi:hypothetical protein